MQHSVKQIAKMYSNLSNLREEKKKFDADDFIRFAKKYAKKYQIVEVDDDFLISTWNSDRLIDDYKRTIRW